MTDPTDIVATTPRLRLRRFRAGDMPVVARLLEVGEEHAPEEAAIEAVSEHIYVLY